MFFSASITLTFVLSLSRITLLTVHISTQTTRQNLVPQACSGPNGTGTCTDLNVASPNTSGPAISPAACTNVEEPQSLVLNENNDCVSFLVDCTINFDNLNDLTVEHFSDDSGTIRAGIKSISCEADLGFVNGLVAGFQGYVDAGQRNEEDLYFSRFEYKWMLSHVGGEYRTLSTCC
ncbi:hypothetical protein C8R47DRAFT_1218211 [Mycena vitilis]|nr:hypothetical protein C8R47DRAFT_1218211 [Mycena vitilis]